MVATVMWPLVLYHAVHQTSSDLILGLPASEVTFTSCPPPPSVLPNLSSVSLSLLNGAQEPFHSFLPRLPARQ